MRRVVVVGSRTTWGFTDGSSSFPYPFKLDTYRETAAERAKQEWIWRGSAGRVFPWIGVLAKGDTQPFCRDGQTKFHQAEKATNKRPPPPKKGLVYWDLLGCIRCPRDTPLISPFLCPYGREDTNRTRYTFIHVLDTHRHTDEKPFTVFIVGLTMDEKGQTMPFADQRIYCVSLSNNK